MFSTLLGTLPIDPAPARGTADGADARLEGVTALGATGLDLVSDGGPPARPDGDPAAIVARWEAAAGAGGLAVKAVLLGPWSATRGDSSSPEAAAERLRPAIVALRDAGCLFVEIAEPDALDIATDGAAAASFADAHRRLVDGTGEIHCSLALTGGNLDGAAPATFFDLPYASYAFDLIAGPDNWRLVAQAPGDRGIVCGALGVGPAADETREVLVWAAHYAASTSGRGLARVGLANAPAPPDGPAPARADVLRKLALVAEASRIAAVESADELAGLLDRRAIDPRAMAGARFAPDRRRRL